MKHLTIISSLKYSRLSYIVFIDYLNRSSSCGIYVMFSIFAKSIVEIRKLNFYKEGGGGGGGLVGEGDYKYMLIAALI